MMLALQEVNPDAFLHNNINGLKVGKVLKVPTEDEVLKLIPAAEAIEQVRQQNQTWAALIGKGARLERKAQAIKIEGLEESGALGGEAEKVAAAQEQNLQGKTVPEAKGSGDGIAGLKIQLSLARETLEIQTQKNEEMQARLREIELQVRTLRQLLSVEDASLARPQEPSEVAIKEEGRTLEEPERASALILSAEEPTTSILSSSVVMESSSGKEIAEIIPLTLSNSRPAMEMAPNQVKPAEEDMGKFEGIWDAFITLRNLLLLGGSSVLLLVLAIWRMRKRKITEKLMQVEVGEEADWSEPVEVLKRRTDREVKKIAGKSASLVAVQAEVDGAIAEAEGHLASNHYHQAAKVLKAALSKEPGRRDLRLKLAEVYYAMNSGKAFMALTEEWTPNRSENEVIGAELVVMGRVLSPSQSLFVSSQQDYKGAREGLEIVSSHNSSLSPWLLTFDEETTELFSPDGEVALEAQISDAEDGALEFDLGDVDLAEHSTSTSVGGAISKAREMDKEGEEAGFDLGGFSSLFEEGKISQKSLGSFSLEFKTEGDDTAFGGLETDASEVEAATLTATNLTNNIDTFDNSSAEETKASFPGRALMDDVDEMEIKLDLARAYIDMGNAEGACSILEEVITAGNEKQRGTGQELLLELAKAS
jgi:pilus assembly protein FimV